jgi:cell division protein FtsB
LERLKQQLNAAVAEIEAHQQQTARLKIIEDAIREHCKAYPFIAFDGASFVYKTGAVPQQLVLEDALSSSEHEAKRMSAENQSLKSEIAGLQEARISDARELRRSRDTLTERPSIAAFMDVRCELTKERERLEDATRACADLEQQLSHLRDDNRQLHAANLVLNAREANILRRCEEQLSKVTGIPVDSAVRLELPLLDVGAIVSELNDVLRRRNDVLEDKNRALAQRIDTLSREAPPPRTPSPDCGATDCPSIKRYKEGVLHDRKTKIIENMVWGSILDSGGVTSENLKNAGGLRDAFIMVAKR